MARPPSQRDDPESTRVKSSARPGSSQNQGQSPVRSRPPHDVCQTKNPSRPHVPASDAHRNAIEAVTYTSSSHRPRNEATEPFARRSPLRRYSDVYDSSTVQVSSDVDAGDDTHREHHGTVQPSASIRHNLNQQPQALQRTSHDPYSQNRVENQSTNLPQGHRTSPGRRLRHELQPPDRHKGPNRSPGRRRQSPQRRHSQSPARRQRSRSPPMRRSQSPSHRQQNRSPPLRRSPRLASRHIRSPDRRGRSPPPTHRPIVSDRYNRSRERRGRSRSPTRTRSTPHGAYGHVRSPERHHQSPVSTRSRSIRHESDRGPILEHRNPNPLVLLDDEDLRQSLIRHNQSNNPHYRSQPERGMRSPVQARRSPRRSPRLSKQHEPLSHERGSERDRDRDPWERRGETSAGVSRVSSHRQALTPANTVLAGHGHQTQRQTVGERHSHEVLQRSPAYRGSNQARIPVGKQTSTNNSQVEHLGENIDEKDERTRDRPAQAPSDRSRKRVRSPLSMDPENRTQAMVRDQEPRVLQNVGRHRSKSPPFSVDGRDSHGENQASRSKRRRGDNSDTPLLENVLASPEKVHTNSHDNGHNRIQHHEENEVAADTIQSKQRPKTSSSKGAPRMSPGQEKTGVAEQLRKSSSSFSHQLVVNTENPNEGPQNQQNDKQATNMQRQQPLQISLRKWVSPSSDRQQTPISTPGYQNSQHAAGARHGLEIVPAPDKLRQEALMVLSNMAQRGSQSKETQKITAFNPTSNKHDGEDSRHGHEKTPDVSGSTGNQKKRTHPLSPPKPSGTSPIPGKSTPVSKPHYESSQLVAGGRHDNESIRRISYPHKQPPGTYQVLASPLPPKPTHVPSTFQKSRLSSQPSHASTQNKEEPSLPLHISRERTDKVSPCMQTGTPSAHGQQTPDTSHESAQLRQQKLSVLPVLVAEPSHTQDVDLNPPKRRQLVKHSTRQPQASHSKTSSASKQIAVDGEGSSKAILQGTQGKESKTISAKSTRALNSTPKQGKIKQGARGTQAQEAKGVGNSKKATKVSAKNERKSFIQILKANGAIPKKKRTAVARKGITKGKLKGRTQAQGIRLEEGKSTKMVADNATNVRKPPATMKLNINPACDDGKGFEGVAIQKDGIRASKAITEENTQSGKSDVRSLPMQKSSPSKKRDSTIKAKGPAPNLQRAEESFYKKVTIGKYITIDTFFVKRDCPDDAAGWSTDVPATGQPIYDVGNQTVKEFVRGRDETQNTKIIATINAAGQDIYVLQDENSRRVELESKFNNSPADMPKDGDGDGDGDRDGGGDAAGTRDGDSQNEAFYHADRDGDGGRDAAGTRDDDSQNEAFYHADRDIVNTIAAETFVSAGDIDQYASNYQLFREDFKLSLLDADVQEDESDARINIGTESDEIGVLGNQAPVHSYESLSESAEMGKANNNDADNIKNAHDDDDSHSHSDNDSGSDDGSDDSNSDDSDDNTDYSNNDDDSHDSDDDDAEKTKHTMEEVEMRQDPETVLVKSIAADEDEIVDIEEAKEENPINVTAAITTPLPPPPPPLLPKTLPAQQVQNVEQSTKRKRGNVLGAENAIDVAATIPTPLPPQPQLPKPLQARPVANVGQSANMKGGHVARAKNAADTATTAVTRPLQSDRNANVGQNAREAAATATRSLQSDQNANAREGGSTSTANGGGAAGGGGAKPVQADELKEAVKRGVEVYHALKAARREQERNAFRKQLEDTERKAAHEQLRC